MAVSKIGKKFSNFFALVHFYEENKFSVMRLKDCIPHGMEFTDDFDLNSWKIDHKIDILWDNFTYPARILQFGKDKKLMETTIDELGSMKIKLGDLPLVQALTKRGNKAAVDKERSNSSLPLKHRSVTVKRGANTDFFENLRKKMHSNKENAYNVECDCKDLKEKLKEKNETIDRLKVEIKNGERSFHEMENKYREVKKKYKEKKKELMEYKRGNFKQEEDTNEFKKFGKISVPLSKLSLCRVTAYSKYVGDLLEVCFGRETLAESVLKGPTNRSHKNNILNVDVINDIMINVMEKFPLVSVGMLRAAIRQKLNTCHKSKVKEVPKNV